MVVVPARIVHHGLAGERAGPQQLEGPQHVVTFARPFAVGKLE